MPTDSHEAYKPAEIAALIETAGVAKAALPLHRMATLAMLAGAFIGFGAAFWCIAMAGADPGFGPQRVLGGVVFALGLILVVVGGAELFTGNALMVMAAVDRRITLGCASAELGHRLRRQPDRRGRPCGGLRAVGPSGRADGRGCGKSRDGKAALPPLEAFVAGRLCNALVCLAVWLSFAARTATDKILASFGPSQPLSPWGWSIRWPTCSSSRRVCGPGPRPRSAGVIGNLIWVTLGNVVGGAGGVALAYRYAYGAMRG